MTAPYRDPNSHFPPADESRDDSLKNARAIALESLNRARASGHNGFHVIIFGKNFDIIKDELVDAGYSWGGSQWFEFETKPRPVEKRKPKSWWFWCGPDL